jgi:hypothetical protein
MMVNRRGFLGVGRLAVLLAVLAVGLLIDGGVGLVPAAEAQQAAAVVTTSVGQVRVKAAGQADFVPLQVGARVLEGADIVSGAGGRAELRLPDGSTLMVAENSRFVVTRLDYDARNQPRAALFHLAIGKLRGFVSKAASTLVAARQGHFAITTPTAVAAVRGTELYVSVDSAGNTVFLAMNGIANVTIGGRTVQLQPGQTVSATPAGFQLSPAGQPAVTAAPPALVQTMQSAASPATAGNTAITNPGTVVISTPGANATINTIVTTSTTTTPTGTTTTTTLDTTVIPPPTTSQVTDATKPDAPKLSQ